MITTHKPIQQPSKSPPTYSQFSRTSLCKTLRGSQREKFLFVVDLVCRHSSVRMRYRHFQLFLFNYAKGLLIDFATN